MKLISLLVILVPIFFKEGISFLQSNEDLSLPDFKRIIDGRRINITDAPYQVSLERLYKHACGGALVNTLFIITAAHCLIHVKNRNWVSEIDLRMRAGTSMAGVQGVIRKIHLVRTPKNFNFSPPKNDIGIVKLRAPVIVSNTIKPIALNGNEVKSTDVAQISGFGSQHIISYFRSQTHSLMMAKVAIFDKSECKEVMESLGFYISADMICAGYKEGHRDACQGDSGGPMTINGSLAGVISWGLGCGVYGRPGIYTGVAYQLGWIQKCLRSIVVGNKRC